MLIQGGDTTHGTGVGGESIYGPTFEDETFEIKHNKKYQLSMANRGPNTNGSQFFISLSKLNWLDGKNVVFGEVLEGINDINMISSNAGPTVRFEIVECGKVEQ